MEDGEYESGRGGDMTAGRRHSLTGTVFASIQIPHALPPFVCLLLCINQLNPPKRGRGKSDGQSEKLRSLASASPKKKKLKNLDV